jgi:hypothetical protein
VWFTMADYYLIVSNPPHRDIEQDHAMIAECLGLTAAEVGMRVRFPAPEIWFVDLDHDAAKQKAEAVYKAGVNCAVISGSVLAAVPVPDHVTSFSVSPTGFVAKSELGEVELPREAHVVAVVSDPLPVEDRMRRDTEGGGHRADLTIHVFFRVDEGWRAVRIETAHVDFRGLGDLKMPTAIGNVHAILKEFQAHFANAVVDERMMGVDYHYMVVNGIVLPKLLTDISDHFDRLDPYELGSLLAFLTAK